MAKVTIIECDRCGGRIRNGAKQSADEKPFGELMLTRGDSAKRRELCTSCVDALEIFLRGVNIETQEKIILDERLLDELKQVRLTANKGIEAYADGASPDVLVSHLRDVATAARRN